MCKKLKKLWKRQSATGKERQQMSSNTSGQKDTLEQKLRTLFAEYHKQYTGSYGSLSSSKLTTLKEEVLGLVIPIEKEWEKQLNYFSERMQAIDKEFQELENKELQERELLDDLKELFNSFPKMHKVKTEKDIYHLYSTSEIDSWLKKAKKILGLVEPEQKVPKK
jgi:hypothetical protein